MERRVAEIPKAVQVACGATHTVTINETGHVYMFGEQPDGQKLYKPIEIHLFRGVPVVQGNLFSAAVTASGVLYTWGKNDCGQLGSPRNPCLVPSIHSVVAVECGDSHMVALTHEGRVFSCGADSFGQLGFGRPDGSQYSMMCITDMLGSHVTKIACGRCHTIVLAHGKMYTFGLNSSGQLGQGHTANQITPIPISSSSNVSQIFAGWDQSFCLKLQTKHDCVRFFV
ncbi:unnamed protein product [Gongylonema pulchrum]|uniref:E3 ubiquitin-protein ligase HERC3 n=1 Tax=Gongylonema pulchrum TaxID=637853 RepID=A0A183D3N2_9BILA|nr:unnamed protein product [Gongylonema pulchrum]